MSAAVTVDIPCHFISLYKHSLGVDLLVVSVDILS